MSSPSIFEIPVDDARTAVRAARYADRLEVCRDLASEGLTPTSDAVTEIVAAARSEGFDPEIAILFQELPPPADGRAVAPTDFRARPEDLARLEDLAPHLAEAGAGSVVLGFLDDRGDPDVEAVAAAVGIGERWNLRIAFHRAFDLSTDPARAVRTLADLGVERTLSAGSAGYDASLATLDHRVERIERAASAVSEGTFSVVPCGGVRSGNLLEFARATPHAHASCRRPASSSDSGGFDEDEARALRALVHRG